MSELEELQSLLSIAETEELRLKKAVTQQREDVMFGRHLGEIRTWKKIRRLLEGSIEKIKERKRAS